MLITASIALNNLATVVKCYLYKTGFQHFPKDIINPYKLRVSFDKLFSDQSDFHQICPTQLGSLNFLTRWDKIVPPSWEV